MIPGNILSHSTLGPAWPSSWATLKSWTKYSQQTTTKSDGPPAPQGQWSLDPRPRADGVWRTLRVPAFSSTPLVQGSLPADLVSTPPTWNSPGGESLRLPEASRSFQKVCEGAGQELPEDPALAVEGSSPQLALSRHLPAPQTFHSLVFSSQLRRRLLLILYKSGFTSFAVTRPRALAMCRALEGPLASRNL